MSENDNESVKSVEPPPGMFRIAKTELVWPGKYNEDGTLREPLHVDLNALPQRMQARRASVPSFRARWRCAPRDSFPFVRFFRKLLRSLQRGDFFSYAPAKPSVGREARLRFAHVL